MRLRRSFHAIQPPCLKNVLTQQLFRSSEAMAVQLHKYQELGLTWLQKCEDGTNQGGILADDMGLGMGSANSISRDTFTNHDTIAI